MVSLLSLLVVFKLETGCDPGLCQRVGKVISTTASPRGPSTAYVSTPLREKVEVATSTIFTGYCLDQGVRSCLTGAPGVGPLQFRSRAPSHAPQTSYPADAHQKWREELREEVV